jgi:carbon monoxide dehydrogenase subunit G
MHVAEHVTVPLALADAWDFVWQVDRLAACVPGCTGVKTIEPGKRYTGQVADHVGPYRVVMDLDVVVQEATAPESIRVLVSGQDRKLGTTQRMDLTVRLRELDPQQTRLDIDAEVEILGKIAALGQFVVKRKVTDVVRKFGDNLRVACSAEKRVG